MKDLVALFEAEGCTDVRTYVQSGNVVFRAPAGTMKGLAGRLAAAIEAKHGLEVPVILRDADALAGAVARNPYLAAGVDPAELHLMFLEAAPATAAVAKLDPDRSPPDTFVVDGAEVFIRCPEGFGRTKLTNAYFERVLGVPCTVRNWKTVLTLVALAEA